MNIKEAAEYLNISVKTLERKIASGDVSVAYVPGATGKQRTFERAELDRLKDAETARAHATTYVARHRVAASAVSSSQALERAGGGQGIEAFTMMIADALQANLAQRNDHVRTLSPADLAHKLTLTLTEAAALSGLSANHLREAIKAGKLKARIVGKGWKIKPEDLRAYVARLLK
jgi:excisionase family DNA binding protein